MSMLRPRPETRHAWMRIADRAGRVRVLGTSVLEAALVAAGGYVVDAFGRPFTSEPDLSLWWSGVVAASRSLADELVEAITSTPLR